MDSLDIGVMQSATCSQIGPSERRKRFTAVLSVQSLLGAMKAEMESSVLSALSVLGYLNFMLLVLMLVNLKSSEPSTLVVVPAAVSLVGAGFYHFSAQRIFRHTPATRLRTFMRPYIVSAVVTVIVFGLIGVLALYGPHRT